VDRSVAAGGRHRRAGGQFVGLRLQLGGPAPAG